MQAVHHQRVKGLFRRPRAYEVHDPVPLREQVKITGERAQGVFGELEPRAFGPMLKIIQGHG